MLRFKPVNNKYLDDKRSKEISSAMTASKVNTMQDTGSVRSNILYGYNKDVSEDTGLINNIPYNTNTHITFSIPILNRVVSGRECTILQKILNEDVTSIADGVKVVNVTENGYEILTADMIDNYNYSNKTLIGGGGILYLLKSIDVEKEICKYLLSSVLSIAKFTKKEYESVGLSYKEFNGIAYVSKKQEPNSVWIIDDYYLTPYKNVDLERLKTAAKEMRTVELEGTGKGVYMPKISALLAFRDDPDVFIDQVMRKLPVLPLGYRPNKEKKSDPLTVLYNTLYIKSGELTTVVTQSSPTLASVRRAYIDLVVAYKELTFEPNIYSKANVQSLLGILLGKEGFIRDELQATVPDYTGRAVITVDPFMSIDTIGVPEKMAIKLYELHALRYVQTTDKNKSNYFKHSSSTESLAEIAKKELEKARIIIGRQPTLHHLGIQAFNVKVVKGNSLVLNPLSTEAFNADFDGDQMHSSIALTEEAIREVDVLMANVNNIFRARDGKSHIGPRQEMVYGLYKCYVEKEDSFREPAVYNTLSECMTNMIDDIRHQRIHLSARCVISGKEMGTVGKAALRVFMGTSELSKIRLGVTPITTSKNVDEKPVTESFYRELLKHIRLSEGSDVFVKVTNNLVRLGFTVAGVYPPNISIMTEVEVKPEIEKFYKRIEYREELFNRGFESEESFSTFYMDEYSKLESNLTKIILETLSDDNGFVQMVKSGARGNKSNLLQMFGVKGLIQKNAIESFNVIVPESLSQQLSGLAHFLSAYGSRQGVIDKVINTHKPGYLARLLAQAIGNIAITVDDCGTKDGLDFSYDNLKEKIGLKDNKDDVASFYTIKEYAIEIMTGRFINDEAEYPLSRQDATNVFEYKIAKLKDNEVIKYEGVKLRSPITCKNTCCVKCYGVDLTTNKLAIKGTPVGYLGAQAISEPMTQLIMKNFQKGGVAGVKNLTSSFDVVESLFELYSSNNKVDGVIYSNILSPVDGVTSTTDNRNGTKTINIFTNKTRYRKKLVVPVSAVVKEIAVKGEPLLENNDDLDINEIIMYKSNNYLVQYFLHKVYGLFHDQVFVDMKYFELVVVSMNMLICTKGNGVFKTGNYYTIKEYNSMLNKNSNCANGCKFKYVFRGLKQIPKIKNNTMEALYLEDVLTVLQRNLVVSGKDDLTDPFVRSTLGLRLGLGSDIKGYVEGRRG